MYVSYCLVTEQWKFIIWILLHWNNVYKPYTSICDWRESLLKWPHSFRDLRSFSIRAYTYIEPYEYVLFFQKILWKHFGFWNMKQVPSEHNISATRFHRMQNISFIIHREIWSTLLFVGFFVVGAFQILSGVVSSMINVSFSYRFSS